MSDNSKLISDCYEKAYDLKKLSLSGKKRWILTFVLINQILPIHPILIPYLMSKTVLEPYSSKAALILGVLYTLLLFFINVTGDLWVEQMNYHTKTSTSIVKELEIDELVV